MRWDCLCVTWPAHNDVLTAMKVQKILRTGIFHAKNKKDNNNNDDNDDANVNDNDDDDHNVNNNY